MKIIPFVHEGLGNSSYLVGLDGGEAALIDPDRSVRRYLDAAAAEGWKIARVFETHLHADFISGGLEVRGATGADVFVPAGAEARFPHRPIHQGDVVALMGGTMTTIASPGHTPEHSSYVLTAAGAPPALFSGGSLMVGGAARTDLIAPAMTDALTRAQFHTIHEAFSKLPDETSLLPTHGGGSFCSAGAGGERTSTLGQERRTNALLLEQSEEAFASWFPATFPAAPRYFFRLRPINQAGPRPRNAIPPPPRLSPAEFQYLSATARVIDTRPQAEFMRGHVPGATSITFRDAFATWLGWLVPEEAPLLFVHGDEPLERLLDECLLVGYERFAGVLEGGVAAWAKAGLPVVDAGLVSAVQAQALVDDGAVALDVRELDEFAAGHLPAALHIPLGDLEARASDLPRDRPLLTYCGHGERAATGLSLLERLGFGQLTNFDGGFEAWQAAGLEIER